MEIYRKSEKSQPLRTQEQTKSKLYPRNLEVKLVRFQGRPISEEQPTAADTARSCYGPQYCYPEESEGEPYAVPRAATCPENSAGAPQTGRQTPLSSVAVRHAVRHAVAGAVGDAVSRSVGRSVDDAGAVGEFGGGERAVGGR